MLEIEQKFRDADFPALRQRLSSMGIGPWSEHDEADHYFNAPDRDFAKTGEAFRMRRIGEKNFLTYKAPKLPVAVKARPELEISLRDGQDAADQMRQLLIYLGYKPVAIVRKHRQTCSLTRNGYQVHVCLDTVDEVGRFAELEILAQESDVEAARKVLEGLAAELGLNLVESRSYLGLLLEMRTA